MSAPQGTDSQLVIGFELADGIPDPALLTRGIPAKYSGFAAKLDYSESTNIDRSGQALRSYPTRASLAPKIDDWSPNVNDLAWLTTHLAGKTPTINSLAAGAVEEWLVTPREATEAAPVVWQDSMFAEAHDGDGAPVRVDGMRLTELAFKLSSGRLANVTAAFLACRDTYCGEAAEETSPATYTGTPVVRGHVGTTFDGATIKVKVTTGPGSGYVAKIKVTNGLIAYGSNEITIPAFGQWVRLQHSSDLAHIGPNRWDALEICFPDSSATALAVNDEWSFAPTRTAVASPVYQTLDPLNVAGLELIVDGSIVNIRDCEFKLIKPHTSDWTGLYARTQQRNGPLTVDLSIDRARDNRDFLKKFRRGTSVALSLSLYGNPLTAGYDELAKYTIGAAQVVNDVRDVNTATGLMEKIELRPFRSGSTDIWSAQFYTTLAALH